MIICNNCGTSNASGASFCSKCGAPQSAASVDAPSGPAAVLPAPGKRSRAVWWVAGGLVVVAAVAAFAVFSRVSALTGNAVVDAIPADAEVYVEIDLMELSEENIQDLIDGYSDVIDDEFGVDVRVPDDLYQVFDGVLDDEFRMSVEDDVMPWIGRYIAVAAFDSAPSRRGGLRLGDWLEAWAIPWGDREGDFLMVLQVRDRDLADAFVEDLADVFDDLDFSVDSASIDDVEFVEASGEFPGSWNYVTNLPYEGDVVFGRSGDVLLVGGSQRVIRDAIRTQAGEQDSIGDAEEFVSAMASHEEGGFVRAYMSGDLATDVSDVLWERAAALLQVGALDLPEDYWAVALEFTAAPLTAVARFTDAGLEVEAIGHIEPELLSDDGIEFLEALSSADLGVGVANHPGSVALPGVTATLAYLCERVGSRTVCDDASEFQSYSAATVTAIPNFSGEVGVQSFTTESDRKAALDEADPYESWDNVVELGAGDWDVVVGYDNDGGWYQAIGDDGVHLGWVDARSKDPVSDATVHFGSSLEASDLYRSAVGTLLEGTIPMFFFDGVATVAAFESRDTQGDDRTADSIRPIEWLIAGLQWDGTTLRASGSLSWVRSDDIGS